MSHFNAPAEPLTAGVPEISQTSLDAIWETAIRFPIEAQVRRNSSWV